MQEKKECVFPIPTDGCILLRSHHFCQWLCLWPRVKGETIEGWLQRACPTETPHIQLTLHLSLGPEVVNRAAKSVLILTQEWLLAFTSGDSDARLSSWNMLIFIPLQMEPKSAVTYLQAIFTITQNSLWLLYLGSAWIYLHISMSR